MYLKPPGTRPVPWDPGPVPHPDPGPIDISHCNQHDTRSHFDSITSRLKLASFSISDHEDLQPWSRS